MKKTTQKNKLTNRLSQYTALSAAIAGVVEASGQVGGPTVVDIDIVGTILLDIDNADMDNDINTNAEFEFINGSSSLIVQPAAAGAEIIGYSALSNAYIYPFALNSGNIISDGATSNSGMPGTWFADSAQSMNVSSTYGQWAEVGGVLDKYLGLRFLISGVTHYGWAKLDVLGSSPNDGVKLKEYYYNPNPEDPIAAGQTKPLSIEENSLRDIKIITKENGISLINISTEISYNLYDLTGKMILEGKIRDRKHTINSESLSNGIFVLKIQDQTNGSRLTKKIVLQ